MDCRKNRNRCLWSFGFTLHRARNSRSPSRNWLSWTEWIAKLDWIERHCWRFTYAYNGHRWKILNWGNGECCSSTWVEVYLHYGPFKASHHGKWLEWRAATCSMERNWKTQWVRKRWFPDSQRNRMRHSWIRPNGSVRQSSFPSRFRHCQCALRTKPTPPTDHRSDHGGHRKSTCIHERASNGSFA